LICELSNWFGWCDLDAEARAAWVQVWIGLAAAAATIVAVVVALRSSRQAIAMALQIHEREAAERGAAQRTVAEGISAALTEELWENASRIYTMLEYIDTFPNDRQLAVHLHSEMTLVEAAVLESCISRLDVFAPDDAKLFARCATRIIQLRRLSAAIQNNIDNGLHQPTVVMIEVAAKGIPDLLSEGLDRAHALSGLPRKKMAPKEVAKLYTAEAAT